MTRLRAFLIALMILVMATSPLLLSSGSPGTATGGRVFAAAAAAPASDNDDDDNDGDGDNDDDDDDDDNDDGDNDDADNDDADNDDDDGDDNDNGGDDDDDDNGNDNQAVTSAPPPAPAAPAAPPAPTCSTPGQETAFQSDDGRVTVRVFGTLPQSVRVSFRLPVDPATVPPAPGPVVGGLMFQVVAEPCDGGPPLATLPAEVNLGVRYADADVAGLNEATFALARLDTTANRWLPAAKQATDPPANFTSASISELGYYVLYQRS